MSGYASLLGTPGEHKPGAARRQRKPPTWSCMYVRMHVDRSDSTRVVSGLLVLTTDGEASKRCGAVGKKAPTSERVSTVYTK